MNDKEKWWYVRTAGEEGRRIALVAAPSDGKAKSAAMRFDPIDTHFLDLRVMRLKGAEVYLQEHEAEFRRLNQVWEGDDCLVVDISHELPLFLRRLLATHGVLCDE